MAKNALALELGPANIYLYFKPKASLSLGTGNSGVYAQAVLGGVAGNSITLTFADNAGNNNPLVVTVVGTAISVQLATDGTGVPTSTANQVIAALGSDASAAFLINAARLATFDGSGVVVAAGPTALSGGSDTGVKTDVGFLGDSVAYQVTTEVADLTGAQTGNIPQNKVTIGGMCKVVIPFKELSFDNIAAGIPNSRLVANSDGTKRRVDFMTRVGESLRARAVKMEIRKILGGFESPLPKDAIIIPEISPADGETSFPFAPTSQREIITNWYAWPDGLTGRWAFTGDEFP